MMTEYTRNVAAHAEAVADLVDLIAASVRGGDTVPAAEARLVRISKRYGLPSIEDIRTARHDYERR